MNLTLAERAPGFGGDIELLMSLLRHLLLEIGMQLDLVDDGNDAGLADDTLEMFGIEIRHADRTGTTLFPDSGESLPGLRIEAAMRRRPVNEVEVDVLGTELLQAALECTQRIVIALIGIPEFGGDEDVLAVEAGRADAFADTLFVVVAGSRIDMTIAGGDRRAHGGSGNILRRLPDAEADLRNGMSVMESDDGLSGHNISPGV